MRNPFKRTRRMPGATSDWDESAHIDLGNGLVQIPEDQLPAEAVERLRGVQVLWDDEGRPNVGVIKEAVEAEVEAWVPEDVGERLLAGEAVPEPGGPEHHEAFEAAVNNPDNWMRDGVKVDADAQIIVCEIDLLTARIKHGLDAS
jgi:hypothetical protein